MENQKEYKNLFIAKKTEKLVTAIYMITSFLKDTENIKIEIRTIANSLLKNINIFLFSGKASTDVLKKNCITDLFSLISFLNIAKNTNLISKMNCEILINTLETLQNILVKEEYLISENDLHIEEEAKYLKQKESQNENKLYKNSNKKISYNFENLLLNKNNEIQIKNIKDKNKNDIKDIFYKRQNNENNIERLYKKQKDIENNQNKILKLNSNTKNKSKQNQDRKLNRREQILNLLSVGVEFSINDISKKIAGCSLKTIQRELNDLVSKNKLKKIGDKRWSKYTLA